jgi:DNA topoisomerase VI subunit B
MDIETEKELEYHTRRMAEILHGETDKESIKDLEGIEKTVRALVQEHVTPKLGIFLSKKRVEQKLDEKSTFKAS